MCKHQELGLCPYSSHPVTKSRYGSPLAFERKQIQSLLVSSPSCERIRSTSSWTGRLLPMTNDRIVGGIQNIQLLVFLLPSILIDLRLQIEMWKLHKLLTIPCHCIACTLCHSNSSLTWDSNLFVILSLNESKCATVQAKRLLHLQIGKAAKKHSNVHMLLVLSSKPAEFWHLDFEGQAPEGCSVWWCPCHFALTFST